MVRLNLFNLSRTAGLAAPIPSARRRWSPRRAKAGSNCHWILDRQRAEEGGPGFEKVAFKEHPALVYGADQMTQDSFWTAVSPHLLFLNFRRGDH